MAIISKEMNVNPTQVKMNVSLSADVEFLIDKASKQQTPVQDILKSRFWSPFSSDLQKFSKQNFKKENYFFHVCFITTKVIESEEHRVKIKRAFVEIIKRYIAKIVFRPHEFRPYVIQDRDGKFLLGRSPDKSPIVLVPKNPEDFKKINQELAKKLEELNRLWEEKYELDDDLLPQYYTPHITILNQPALRDLEITKGKTKKVLLEHLNASIPKETFTLKDHNYKV